MTDNVENSFDMYGRIKEGVHVAGYSFERACSHLEWLLDKGRWKLGGRFDDVNKFLESIKLDQFRVVTEKRQRIAKRIKELQPTASQRAIAKVVGVDEKTVRNDLRAADNSAPVNEQAAPIVNSQSSAADNSAPAPTLSGSEAAKTAERKATQKQRKKEKAEQKPAVQQARSETAAAVDGLHTDESVEAQGWVQLGEHRLFVGDSSSEAFIAEIESAKLAFADPPYNAGAAEWDNDFCWNHDYLSDLADVVAVTPGISAIPDFMRLTGMPYKWSMAAHINNGMTRGAVGFGNWMYVALFAAGSVHRQAQDHTTISIGHHPGTEHKGRKPAELLVWLIETFTEPGDTVIDPFGGSGTTLFVCERLGRKCITAEINRVFAGQIISLWNHNADTSRSNAG